MKARDVITKALKKAQHPFVLTSFGKDSSVAIHLCAEQGVRDVLYIRPVDEAIDDAHRALMTKRYKLRVTEIGYGRGFLYFVNKQPNFVAFPFLAPATTGLYPARVDRFDGQPFVCGDEMLEARRGRTVPFKVDCVFTGQKRTDDREACGGGGLFTLLMKRTGVPQYTDLAPGLKIAQPLAHWTDAQVWAFLAKHDVPVSRVYADDHTKYPHKQPWCVRCHDPYEQSIVYCPKQQRNVGNFARGDGLDHLQQLGVITTEEMHQMRVH